ncbi:MAG: hypothetical protein ACFE95_02945 [Candidatus Hodarchaeota archaeon]
MTSDKELPEKDPYDEALEELRRKVTKSTHKIFSEICNCVQDAAAALDGALDVFTQYIGIEHNLPPVTFEEREAEPTSKSFYLDDVRKFGDRYPEYLMIEKIQGELHVIASSISRFNEDIKQYIIDEGWGEPWYDTPEAEKLKQFYADQKKKISRKQNSNDTSQNMEN